MSHRPGPVEAVGAVDAQTAPTAPWKTLRVFHKLPQGTTFTTSPTENPEEPFKVRGEKQRKIDNPDELLKFVQRRIRERLLAVQRLPALVRGCVRGESPFSNAEPHCDRRNVASIDIRNFYPSVGHGMVYNLWRRLGFEPALSGLLTRLTTTAGRLPQGAPTSDTLANLVLGPTDGEVANISHLLGLEPSRYLDDITLSGDRAQECIPLVIGALRRQGFSVRHKKTSNAGPSRRHSVTGYSVNAKSPSVPQPHRMKVRALVHHLILARQREPYRERRRANDVS